MRWSWRGGGKEKRGSNLPFHYFLLRLTQLAKTLCTLLNLKKYALKYHFLNQINTIFKARTQLLLGYNTLIIEQLRFKNSLAALTYIWVIFSDLLIFFIRLWYIFLLYIIFMIFWFAFIEFLKAKLLYIYVITFVYRCIKIHVSTMYKS